MAAFRHERTPRRNILGSPQLFISEVVESHLPWGTFSGHDPAAVPHQCPLPDELRSSCSTICFCPLAGHRPADITQAKCSPRSSQVCCCPHWCLDTSPWRLVASPSDVIHACQQLWIVGCSSHLWHLLLRPRFVLKWASSPKQSLASLKSSVFQTFLKTRGEKCLWHDSKWRDTRKAF